jgi:thiol-disulfide isomerase/thioredoxin
VKAAPVYDESADAKKQIADALAAAKKDAGGKRVLIQWGGNWCPWCIRLHQLMTTDEKISAALKDGYVVVHVDAGRKEKNLDLAAQYKADVATGGYPYLTVLDSDGKVIANQETAALEVKDAKGESVSVAAGHDPVKVLKFLEANKAPAAGAAAGGGK